MKTPQRRIHILTVVTNSELYFPVLLNSCFRNGAVSCKSDSPVIFHILGFGEKWGGYTWRSQKILGYLNSRAVSDDDLVCVVDGYDVICMRNLHDLADEYYRLCANTGRIIVGHTNTWPWMDFIGRIWYGSVSGMTINAGTYIGPVSSVRGMIWSVWAGQPPTKDDQILLTKYVAKMTNRFYIDYRGDIFWTICRTWCDILPIVKSRIGEPPFFLHGSGDTNLNGVVEYLGYENKRLPWWKHITNFFQKLAGHLAGWV